MDETQERKRKIIKNRQSHLKRSWKIKSNYRAENERIGSSIYRSRTTYKESKEKMRNSKQLKLIIIEFVCEKIYLINLLLDNSIFNWESSRFLKDII